MRRHKIDHEAVAHPALKRAIFGHYADSRKPDIGAVRKGFKLIGQALRTLPEDPVRALHFFVANGMKAPADDHDEKQSAMTARFWENANLLEAVVNSQPASELIVQFLSPAETRRVERETGLKRIVETAKMRDSMGRKRYSTQIYCTTGGSEFVDTYFYVVDRFRGVVGEIARPVKKESACGMYSLPTADRTIATAGVVPALQFSFYVRT